MSDLDKSLEDIIKERKLGNQRVKATNTIVKKTIVRPSANMAKNVGAKVKLNRGAQNKFVTIKRFQVNDVRKRILINRGSKIVDARNKLKRLEQITDARQKLNRLKTNKHNRPKFEVDNIKPLAKSVTNIAFTRTVRNDAALDFKPIGESKTSNPVHRGVQKHVLIDKGGLTVISKPNSPVAIVSPPSLLFSRTVNSLVREANQNARISTSSGGLATLKVWPSVSYVMKRNLDDNDDDLEHATLESFSAAKKLRPTVSSSSSLSQRLQLRLGANGNSSRNTERESYTVLVSNLQQNVSQEDIVELFGDVGTLREVKMIRQGTAMVVFLKLTDAQKAVDVYNNRQPMICRILQPQQMKSNKPASVSRLRDDIVSGKTSTMHSDRISVMQSAKSRITPDVDAIHEALFRRAPSRTNAISKASIIVTM